MQDPEFPTRPTSNARPRAAISAGAWSAAGMFVGAVTGQCVWNSLCFGDFSAGAWIAGIIILLLQAGAAGGAVDAATTVPERSRCAAVAAAWAVGMLLGGLGLPASFVFVLLTIRRVFEDAGKSLETSGAHAQIILLSAILGWAAGLMLGTVQGCVFHCLMKGDPLRR
jgi:hypothetical protein